MASARAVATAILWFGIFDCHRASAQENLRVEVPAACGSRDAFLAEVATLQRTASAQLTVSEVVISLREDRAYELRLVSPEGPRLVVDADCRTLFKTATIIAATLAQSEPAMTSPSGLTPAEPAGESGATDSAIASTPPATERSTTSVSAPATTPQFASASSGATKGGTESAPSAGSHAKAPPSSETSPAVQLGVGAAGFVGLSPEPHLGIEALAGMSGKRWGGHLAARLLPPRSMLVRDELGVRETVWGARLSASVLATSWLRISPGLSGYWISAQGLGVSDPTTDGVGLLAPELEVAVSLLVEAAFRAEIGVQGRWGLTRPRFEVESGQLVYELPRLGGSAVLRILWTRQ